MHLEDQVSAKRCGHRPGKALVPAGEMAFKASEIGAVVGRPALYLLALLLFLPDVAIRRLQLRGRLGRGPIGWGRPRPTSATDGSTNQIAGPASPTTVLFGGRKRR
jgi:hypothetical protein